MSMEDSPCKGCTAETGRSPTCHNKDCPHGWYEWDQRHQAAREALRAHKLREQAAEGVLINAQAKGRPTRRRYK